MLRWLLGWNEKPGPPQKSWWENDQLASRKFVDLVWKASSKFGVWDPPGAFPRIQLGEYGMINKDTGNFETRGNIFTDPALADYLGPNGPPLDTSEDVISIISNNAKSSSFDAGASADIQVAKVEFQAGWDFGKGAGVALIAHKPRHRTLPHGIDYTGLANKLNGLYLVTSVTVCPAYALYLSTKENSGVSFALSVEAPLPVAPIVTGPSVKTKWHNRYGTGIYREGNKEQDAFTVLYDVRVLKKKGWLRDTPEPGDDDPERLQPARPPWGDLTDDGEEDVHITAESFAGPPDDSDDE